MSDEFWEVVKDVADEWERAGWLQRYCDQSGIEWWELTPLGRRELGLKPLPDHRN